MRKSIKFLISAIISLILFIPLLFFNIVPCKISFSPLASEPNWGFCKLLGDFGSDNHTANIKFLGFFENIILFLLISWLLIFIIISIIIFKVFKSK